MTETPESQERQVARGLAFQRAQRPRARAAVIIGAVFGAVIGALGVLDPVLSLGASASRPGLTVESLLRASIGGALGGAVVFSVGALLLRRARRAIAAARYGAPVA